MIIYYFFGWELLTKLLETNSLKRGDNITIYARTYTDLYGPARTLSGHKMTAPWRMFTRHLPNRTEAH